MLKLMINFSLQANISNLKDTLQMLQLQKLSTSLLTATQLNNIYSEVMALAKTNKLQPLISRPQDLYQLDTSYLRVPCSNPANLNLMHVKITEANVLLSPEI